MTLAAGTRLGPYEIVAPLGAGGMGEVYRARDGRLDRDVAIKVLPALAADDPDRLRRFEQEARAVAALNHPNVLAVFDIGSADGTSFIVSELLEGETLRARLDAGPLPARKAVEYAVQIAQGVGAAHEKGIAHRDLKPQNVFVTRDDRVKILDFGLAKLLPQGAAAASGSIAPTIAGHTAAGVVLGTVGYMAPEQVRGTEADHRADIFAIGVLLVEMLTGERPFDGASPAEVMSAILREDPPDLTGRAQIPPALQQIVRRCLEKAPDARFQSARDLAFAIGALSTPAGLSSRPEAGTSRSFRAVARRVAPLILLLAAGIAIGAFGVGVLVRAPRDVVQLAVLAPEGTTLTGSIALSPDGKTLAFSAQGVDGVARLYLRPLSAVDATPLPGTDGALYPFWSPDARSIGFFAGRKLKRIDVAGGPADTLADASDPRGGTWSASGEIVFAPMGGSGLSAVGASGGPVRQVTRLDPKADEVSHRWPRMLPDGRHFTFLRRVAPREQRLMVAVASLDDPTPRLLFAAESGAVYARGLLLAVQGETLIGMPFDATSFRVTGKRTVIAEHPWQDPSMDGLEAFDAAGEVLAYRAGGSERQQVVTTDASGREIARLERRDNSIKEPRFSPDGGQLLLSANDPDTGTLGSWIHDLARGTLSRAGPAQNNSNAIWSPDGTRIAFSSDRRGSFEVFVASLTTGAQRPMQGTPGTFWRRPESWSPDGRWILYYEEHPETRRDLWVAPADGGADAVVYLRTPASEWLGRFSPDGRWIAYASDESGRDEVYVGAFPTASGKLQVSTSGGTEPKWRGDGRMLYYLSPDNYVVAVPIVVSGASVKAGPPQRLFQARIGRWSATASYDVSPRGDRFAITTTVPALDASAVRVTVGWTPPRAQ